MDNRLDFGSAFSRVFELYSRHVGPLLMWAAAVQLAVSLLVALVLTAVIGGNVGLALVGGAVTLGFAVLASAILTGAYVIGLDQADRDGTFPAFGEVWSRVSPRLGALIVTSIIAAVATALGFVALIIPGLVLLTWWAVFAPVVMLENKSGGDALGRSRELVRGNGWTVFGLIFVVGLLTNVASSIIGSIVGAILGGRDEFLGMFGSQFVSGTLLTPISALLAVVIYHRLRGDGAGGDDMPPPPAVEQPRTDGPTSSGPFV